MINIEELEKRLNLLKKYGQIAPLVYFVGVLDLKNRQQSHLGLIFLQ